MCYMHTAALKSRPTLRLALDQVGVRELRQNLSVYLARVIQGETLEVTDRGRAVALLTPLPEPSTTVERLVASGRAVPATTRLDQVPAVRGRVPANLGASLRRALDESRDDRW